MNILQIKSLPHYALCIAGALLLALQSPAQTVTNTNPNRVISWNLDDYGTINPTDLAGLAPATNWIDTYLNNVTTALPDNTGAATTLNLVYGSYNTYQVIASHPGADANGTKNRELLNGFLNAGPASWGPYTTNTWVALTNVPYPSYDVVIYLNSDTSGRHSTISDGATSYSFSTMGSPSVSSANALFVPTTQTNASIFPTADFAFFRGETNPDVVFTTYPKSGNDQWLGIAGFQVIQSSNVYVLYGPAPGSQIVPVGQAASFSVMAGGANPTYQWQHDGTNLVNATNAIYSMNSTSLVQDGIYDVIITNGFNSVTSSVATLTFYSPKLVEWDGNGGTWDTSSLFWTTTHGATTTNYTETDHVLFDPLGAAQPAVTLAATFSPSSITVSNSSYTFTGGGIAGNGPLHLENNASLVWDMPDTGAGPVIIDNGSILQLDNLDTSGSLGSGSVTNNGGLLFDAAGDFAYGYPIWGSGGVTNEGPSGTITLGNNINSQYLVQEGGGSLLLQGSNTLSGGLLISGGTVMARSAYCLGSVPVTVSAGELQLIFNIDFAGSSINLSGGILHGGISGNDIAEPQISLTTDSQINVDPNDSLILNNPSGIAGAGYNLTVNGIGETGTLILAGTNNTWNSVTVNFGTLQVGNGGAVGGLGAGIVSDGGSLAVDLGGNITITNAISGIGLFNQIGSNTVTLTGDLSGLTGGVNVLSGGLNGSTTIGSPVYVAPGASLGAGAAATLGTLVMNGGLTLGGNLVVKLNKSLSQSNDVFQVSGTLVNTNAGIITVNNLGPALVPGDRFYLFNAPVAGGASLTIAGAGMAWSNNLANDGSIIALAASGPALTGVTLNPIFGSSYPVTLSLAGNGFESGCSVTLSNITTAKAESAAVTFNSSASLVVSANVGTAPSSWNATVVNPGGLSSSPVSFSVLAPPRVLISGSAARSLASNAFLISGSGGQPGDEYVLDGATNLHTPVVWVPIVTNQFDSNGHFAFTNTMSAGAPTFFLRVQE